ncbi:MAG: helix-turn-helix domain-containing protein, partial [Candidatus Woesearchaeota archaeon]|nr:helix-turn-helix domain-containing protein [Candidatus Woesearchaeota archaeon]
ILYIEAHLDIQNKIMNFITKQKSIREFHVLEETNEHKFVLIITRGNDTVIERVLKNKCFVLEPALLLQGNEYWIVGTKSKQNVVQLLDSLKNIGKPDLVSITQYSFKREALTKKQKNAIEHAYCEGYYEWPRKINVGRLASNKRLSKSAYIEHLRKAEIKVIKQFIESH